MGDKNISFFQSFSFSDNWEFKIFKTNKRGEKTVEEILSPEEMAEAFGVVNEQISADASTESYLEVKEPKKVEKTVSVDNELKR